MFLHADLEALLADIGWRCFSTCVVLVAALIRINLRHFLLSKPRLGSHVLTLVHLRLQPRQEQKLGAVVNVLRIEDFADLLLVFGCEVDCSVIVLCLSKILIQSNLGVR